MSSSTILFFYWLPTNSHCRRCPHVVVTVGLEHFSDLWGYEVEPLMPDKPKVRDQTKRNTEVYAVRSGTSRYTSETRLLIRRDCTVNQRRRNSGRGPHLFKKAKAEVSTMKGARYRVNWVCQGRSNHSNEIPRTWHLGLLTEVGF